MYGRDIRHFAAQEHIIGKHFVRVEGISRDSLMTLVEVCLFLYIMDLKDIYYNPTDLPFDL